MTTYVLSPSKTRISLPLFLLFLLNSIPQAFSNGTEPQSTNYRRYPKNLHRLYDGTWDSSANFPFNYLPHSSGPNQSSNSSEHALSNHAALPIHSESLDVSFQKKSGFTLLTIRNYPSDLGSTISEVFGDLILRDGPYRSPRDVAFRLIGVYDTETGTLVLVGDALFQDVQSSLQRLYDTFVKSRPTASNISPFNKTKEEFILALSGPFKRHLKQSRSQRNGVTRSSVVSSNCPFSASFAITPGTYEDSTPSDADFSTSYNPNDSPDGRVPMPGTSVFSGHGDEEMDSVSAQDEYVEMKGQFMCDACHTKANIVLSTLDTETLFGKAINYTLLVTVVAFIQVVVLIRQMEMTSTQAGARRVSLVTVGMQAVADSYLCLGHLTMGIAVQALFNAFATAAFFKFICFSIFLMRWMLLIWKARRPSGFSEGWEAMRRELSMLYSRFYGSLLLGIFLLYQLQNHIRLFVFGIYSFWIPQIILNIVEDHRRPLLPLYIAGTSLTRLAIPLYFWACPRNFLHIEPHPDTALSLVVWLLAQALILLSQHKFGPRWFIPKQFLPEKYDYFRTVSVDEDGVVDLEAMETADAAQPLIEGRGAVDIRRECCICMESVGLNSRERMITPCNHFFHAVCLERWLEVRLECALCRSPVPPP